jgi:hypothetical protein
MGPREKLWVSKSTFCSSRCIFDQPQQGGVSERLEHPKRRPEPAKEGLGGVEASLQKKHAASSECVRHLSDPKAPKIEVCFSLMSLESLEKRMDAVSFIGGCAGAAAILLAHGSSCQQLSA